MKMKTDLNLIIGKTIIAGNSVKVIVNSASWDVEASITSDKDQTLYDYKTFENWAQSSA